MNFITTVEAAEKWGISSTRITILAKEGRIPGAKQISSRWMIPETAEKPADARTSMGKMEKAEESFRYPSFEFKDVSSFHPPLNEEELQIKASKEAIYSGNYEDADVLLGNLPEKATNRYRRIFALFLGCIIDGALCNVRRFMDRYVRMVAELQEDFPHKEEMKECPHELDALFGKEDHYASQFRVVPGYPYHESFLPHLAALSALFLAYPNENRTPADLAAAELNCILLENTDAYADLQTLHMSLCVAYGLMGQQKEALIHFKKCLSIAQKYGIYFHIAASYYYIKMPLEPAFADFPKELKKKVEAASEDMHRRYMRFVEEASQNSIYNLLPSGDYIFLYYAVEKIPYKEIARRLHISISTVSKRYGKIYDLLGVKGKNQVAELYKQFVGGTFFEA